jgi:hypothetical protein
MRGINVTARSGMVRWLVIGGFGLVVFAGCGGDGTEETASDTLPTRTLAPPTVASTPESVTADPTPTDLPSPATLLPDAPAPGAAVISAQLGSMIARATTDLIEQHGVDAADVRLLSVETFVWDDAAWGCQSREDGDPVGGGTVTPGYRLVFSADNHVYVYHTDRGETFFVCDDSVWLTLEGQPVPVEPIAVSMVELSTRDAARRLNVPEESITLTGLLTLTWPDSSVGCPKPGGEYQDEITPGYRIVLDAGEQMVIYHTSIRHIVFCTSDEEILPGLLRQAIPRPE